MKDEKKKKVIIGLMCILLLIVALLMIKGCQSQEKVDVIEDVSEVVESDAEIGEKEKETDNTGSVSDTKEEETTNTVSNNQTTVSSTATNSETKPSTITIRAGEYLGYSTNNFEDKTSDLGLNPYHDSNKDDYSNTVAKGSVVWHGLVSM